MTINEDNSGEWINLSPGERFVISFESGPLDHAIDIATEFEKGGFLNGRRAVVIEVVSPDGKRRTTYDSR